MIEKLDETLKSKDLEQALRRIEDIRNEIAVKSEKEAIIEFVAEGLDGLLQARGIDLRELMKERKLPVKSDQPEMNNHIEHHEE